jgi:hypothetical protein
MSRGIATAAGWRSVVRLKPWRAASQSLSEGVTTRPFIRMASSVKEVVVSIVVPFD